MNPIDDYNYLDEDLEGSLRIARAELEWENAQEAEDERETV
nr:hypothetical protein [Paenibacillus polymyxa]